MYKPKDIMKDMVVGLLAAVVVGFLGLLLLNLWIKKALMETPWEVFPW